MTLVRAISAAFVLALIAACDVMPADSFRDPGAPISATTRFDPAAFSGRGALRRHLQTTPLRPRRARWASPMIRRVNVSRMVAKPLRSRAQAFWRQTIRTLRNWS